MKIFSTYEVLKLFSSRLTDTGPSVPKHSSNFYNSKAGSRASLKMCNKLCPNIFLSPQTSSCSVLSMNHIGAVTDGHNHIRHTRDLYSVGHTVSTTINKWFVRCSFSILGDLYSKNKWKFYIGKICGSSLTFILASYLKRPPKYFYGEV